MGKVTYFSVMVDVSSYILFDVVIFGSYLVLGFVIGFPCNGFFILDFILVLRRCNFFLFYIFGGVWGYFSSPDSNILVY